MPKPLIFLAAGFLFVGVLPLPYGYYMLLRFIACGIFAWAAYITFKRDEEIIPWVFVILAIVFNPIIKIHFPKEMWAVIDFCLGLFLVLISGRIQDHGKQSA